MLNRREFLRQLGLTAGAAALGLHGTPARGAAVAGKKGINVLFLMTDQHHFRLLGAAGNPLAHTPNLDRLAREGAFFEDHFVPVPYCSPTRASLISGQWPHRVAASRWNQFDPNRPGILENIESPHGVMGTEFPSTEMTLHDHGWQTAHRGKWHLGDTGDFACYESLGRYSDKGYLEWLEQHVPAAQFAGDPGQAEYHDRPLYMIPDIVETNRKMKEWAVTAKISERLRRAVAGGAGQIIGRTPIPLEYLPEGYITKQVLEKMEEFAPKGNWMITCSFSPPHPAYVAPEPYYGMLARDKAPIAGDAAVFPAWMEDNMGRVWAKSMTPAAMREYIAVYYGQVAAMDALFGKILDKLDELGQAANTLVLFTSDHGDMVGRHGFVGKGGPIFYDNLMHVPLLMRLPGVIPAGKRVGGLSSAIDIMPTLLDYCSQAIPPAVQGRSLRPLIEGQSGKGREYVFGMSASSETNVMRMVRSRRWKYVCRTVNGRHDLYDLDADPNENVNLIEDPAAAKPENLERARERHAVLRRWMAESGDPWASFVPETLMFRKAG
ncbi:MAG: sulfatase-like hydrolase/transferase [bacterium]|nr:sulfatase-like hydrolase/transferase [bacterium]